MKNKLTALLATLLLCLSRLPSQNYAVSATVPNDLVTQFFGAPESPYISESNTSEWITILAEEGPGPIDGEH